MNGVYSIVHHDDERVVAWCHDRDVQEVPENHGQPWTQVQDKHLLQCYKKNWPVLAIARFLKRNCYAIVCRLERLGVDWRRVMTEYRHSPVWDDRQIPASVLGQSTIMIVFDEVSNFPFHPKEKCMKENINGRFWMIQNGDIKTAGNGLHAKDKFGRSMVEWPGRSIFPTKAEADLAAKDMAAQFPDSKFYVMEAVSMYETTKPPVKCTTYRKR